MNIVVDASVIVAVIANESEKGALIQMTQDADLIAPNSIHWEIGNAFSAMLKRKRITLEQAQKALEIYRSISIRFVDVDITESLALVDELNIYAYDAYLLRCAIKFASPLITLDRTLLAHARQKRIQVMEVIPWPYEHAREHVRRSTQFLNAPPSKDNCESRTNADRFLLSARNAGPNHRWM